MELWLKPTQDQLTPADRAAQAAERKKAAEAAERKKAAEAAERKKAEAAEREKAEAAEREKAEAAERKKAEAARKKAEAAERKKAEAAERKKAEAERKKAEAAAAEVQHSEFLREAWNSFFVGAPSNHYTTGVTQASRTDDSIDVAALSSDPLTSIAVAIREHLKSPHALIRQTAASGREICVEISGISSCYFKVSDWTPSPALYATLMPILESRGWKILTATRPEVTIKDAFDQLVEAFDRLVGAPPETGRRRSEEELMHLLTNSELRCQICRLRTSLEREDKTRMRRSALFTQAETFLVDYDRCPSQIPEIPILPGPECERNTFYCVLVPSGGDRKRSRKTDEGAPWFLKTLGSGSNR